MSDPTPAPTVDELDQAVIDASRDLADAQQEEPLNPARIAACREAVLAARAARGWPYA